MYAVYINGKLQSRSNEIPQYQIGTTRIKGMIITVVLESRCPKCGHFCVSNEMAAYGGHEDCEVASKTGYASKRGSKHKQRTRRPAHGSKE